MGRVSELEDTVNEVYGERNYVALLTALVMNDQSTAKQERDLPCGWYNDTQGGVPGFSRVISIAHGKYMFHVPDSMPLGRLPIIKPSKDNPSSEEVYRRIKDYAACQERHANN